MHPTATIRSTEKTDPEPCPLQEPDAPARPVGLGQAGQVALVGLLLLAIFYTLYFARLFFLPIILALHLGFLLSPAVARLRRLGLPEPLGAALVLAALVTATGLGGYLLSGPASDWVAKIPDSARNLEQKLRDIRRPVQAVQQAATQVEQLAAPPAPPAGARPPVVQVKPPGVMDSLVSGTHTLIAGLALMFLTLFFYLATGDLLLRKIVRVLPTLTDKKRAVDIFRETEAQVSGYLRMITLINAVLGLILGVAFALLDMPNPALWGALAFVLNYVPYVGPLTGMVVLSIVAGVTFDSVGHALLIPGVYLVAHNLETNVLTPILMGRRLWLNPLVIFLWLSLWFWLWGFVGAIVAVPMLKTLKIFCDNIPPLAPVAEFLGR